MHHATLHITLIPPLESGLPEQRKAVQISRDKWEKSFAPLPRDHDAPALLGGFDVAEEVREKRTLRKVVARHLAASLAHALAKEIVALCGEADPVKGYSRQDWERLTGEKS